MRLFLITVLFSGFCKILSVSSFAKTNFENIPERNYSNMEIDSLIVTVHITLDQYLIGDHLISNESELISVVKSTIVNEPNFMYKRIIVDLVCDDSIDMGQITNLYGSLSNLPGVISLSKKEPSINEVIFDGQYLNFNAEKLKSFPKSNFQPSVNQTITKAYFKEIDLLDEFLSNRIKSNNSNLDKRGSFVHIGHDDVYFGGEKFKPEEFKKFIQQNDPSYKFLSFDSSIKVNRFIEFYSELLETIRQSELTLTPFNRRIILIDESIYKSIFLDLE